MLRIYVAPNGNTYQYEEGTEPEGYKLLEPEPAEQPTKAKAQTPRNKARKTQTK